MSKEQSLIEVLIKKAIESTPDKMVNERTQQEIHEARKIIIHGMSKAVKDMTWEEYKPWEITSQNKVHVTNQKVFMLIGQN